MDKNLFTNRLNQLGIKKQVDAGMVASRSQKIIEEALGKRGAENIRIISFKRGVLKIATTNSAWSAECRQLIIKLKTPPVERVVFVGFNSELNL